MRRLLLAASTAASGALLLVAPSALGCSCAGGIPVDQRLRDADAGMVGVVTARRETAPGPDGSFSSIDPSYLTVRVEKEYKADLPDELVVRTARSGSSCGLEANAGDRISVLLHRSDGEWTTGLCSTVGEDELAAAAARLPKPGQPVHLLSTTVAGPTLTHALVSVDASGATLARRDGAFRLVDVCPGGGRAVVERRFVAGPEDRPDGLLVVDTGTLGTVREVQTGLRDGEVLLDAGCRDGLGAALDLTISEKADDRPPAGYVTRLVEELPTGLRTAYRTRNEVLRVGSALVLTFDGRRVREVRRADGRTRIVLRTTGASFARDVRKTRVLLDAARGGAITVGRLGARKVPPGRRIAGDPTLRLVPFGVLAVGGDGRVRYHDEELRGSRRLAGTLGTDPVLFENPGSDVVRAVVNRPGRHPRLADVDLLRGRITLSTALLRGTTARVVEILPLRRVTTAGRATLARATSGADECPYRGRT